MAKSLLCTGQSAMKWEKTASAATSATSLSLRNSAPQTSDQSTAISSESSQSTKLRSKNKYPGLFVTLLRSPRELVFTVPAGPSDHVDFTKVQNPDWLAPRGGINMKQQVSNLLIAGLGVSLLSATAAYPQALNPPYLAEMPVPARVIAEIKGKDAEDTGERQMGALIALIQIMDEM